MGLLEDSSAWLADMLAEADGATATIKRGARSGTLTVTFGRTLFAVSAQPGSSRVIWGDADFLFKTADYVLGDAETRPAKGDTLTVSIAGESCVFEASTPTGEKVWRYDDPRHVSIRLHTKRVE